MKDLNIFRAVAEHGYKADIPGAKTQTTFENTATGAKEVISVETEWNRKELVIKERNNW